MFKINNFYEAIEKLDELIIYESVQLGFLSIDNFLLAKEDRLYDTYFSGFQYWIMKNFIHNDTEIMNEFKQYNINNAFSAAHYIMRGFWRFCHNKTWSLESIINENIMQDIME